MEHVIHELRADAAQINQASMMEELAASLSHEIKQPIAAALMNAETCVRWLRRDAPDLAEACEAASRMVSNATRAAEIVDRVRSLYRRDTSMRELLDLNEIIGEVIFLLRDEANRHFVSIRTQLDVVLPQITADRVLQQLRNERTQGQVQVEKLDSAILVLEELVGRNSIGPARGSMRRGRIISAAAQRRIAAAQRARRARERARRIRCQERSQALLRYGASSRRPAERESRQRPKQDGPDSGLTRRGPVEAGNYRIAAMSAP